jgi:hypothetical protein
MQRPLPIGPRGWPASQTPFLASPTLQPLTSWLHGDALHEAVEGNSKTRVGGGRTRWRAGHVARPAGLHLACY